MTKTEHVTALADTGSPRVAAVGCGYWGRNLVRNFAALGGLAAVFDADPGLAARFAGEHKVPVRAWPELLDDPAIDAVAIATPAATHFELAGAALAAGKHVFVEKPMALTVAEAERLVAAAEAGGRVLMVGHLLQYHPAFLALRELVRRGDLGRLQYVYSHRLNLGKVRREENILWSFAPHDISMILSLVGSEPDEVTAVGANYLHKAIADVTTTHLSFAGGEQAHVFVSWLHPFKEQKLVVVGEKGMAVFDDGQSWPDKVQVFPHKIDWVNGLPQPAKAEPQGIAVEPAEPLRLECQHFLDCVATGSQPRTDGAEGVRVLRVLEAAERSVADKRPVRPFAAAARPKHAGVSIHESAYVDDPCEIGEGTKIWHFSHVLPRVRIGRSCVIGQNVVIGPDVAIGDRCKVQNNVSIYKGVTLEDGVFCGPSCVFTNVSNPRAEIERKDEFRPTRVGRGATIGANATIVCGHDVGAYAFIAAGAVVTADVPAYALMAGVPARRIGWMSRAGGRLGPDLICPIEGRRYRQTASDRLEEIES